MPQMSPIWWVSLFLMFVCILMIFYFLVYFVVKYKYSSLMMISTENLSWLW